ncbi:MAG: FIST signal transduction protein [Myxococcota bacterium]
MTGFESRDSSANTAEQLDEPLSPSADVRVGHVRSADTATAIEQLLNQLDAENASLTVVFHSPTHDEAVVARRLDKATGSRGVAGSTAGELAAGGFYEHTMTGMALHGSGVKAAIEIVPQLRELSLLPLMHLPSQLARGIGLETSDLDPERHVWLLLVDGLSCKEDLLTPFFVQSAPKRMSLVGGSLGDGEEFQRTRISHYGRVYDDAAAVVLLEYDRPFSIIHHTHMTLSDTWIDVTRTSRGGRILEEINGEVAAVGYAKVLGMDPSEITTGFTSSRPLGFRFRGRAYPCSVINVQADGSFMLGCSIQSGERLNILRPTDLVAGTRATMRAAADELAEHGAEPRGSLLFNCLGRYLEAREQGTVDELGEALGQYPVCGLNTYGEQFESMHFNHSLTGLMFG